jgi:uncharacterized cupin superfamily protein
MEIFNLNAADGWDGAEERERFGFKDWWVGAKVGGELLGASMYEITPGKNLWPYHTHHANEEWVVVLRGRPTLRTAEGERELVEGDVACFPRGAAGAHQLRNDTAEPARVLMLSSLLSPDVIEYLDSGKLAATDAKGQRLFRTKAGEPAEYWEGEE